MASIFLGTNTVTRLHLDGTVDSTFAPVFAADAAISQLLLQVDGQVIAAGTFTQVNGVAANGIVRLNGVEHTEKVANISTRALVGTGDAVEIGGFIVTGAAEKSVVIRAIGPSLQVDGTPLLGVLSNPRLELRDSTGRLVAQNDDWRESQEGEIIASGLAPLHEQESAIAAGPRAGAIHRGCAGQGRATICIALVEILRVYQCSIGDCPQKTSARSVAAGQEGGENRADSASSRGARPVASISACWLSFQSSLVARRVPLPSRSSRVGSWSAPATPKDVRLGPIARTSTVASSPSPRMNPPIMTLSPVLTKPRVEMLARLPAAASRL